MKNKTSEAERIWFNRVNMAKSFNGNGKAFCVSEGIDSSSFYYWRKRLSQTQERMSAFLPVVINSNSSPEESDLTTLPEAKWLAEVLTHLIRGLA